MTTTEDRSDLRDGKTLYEHACRIRDMIEEDVLGDERSRELLERVEERNACADRENEWNKLEGALRERSGKTDDELMEEPLSIEWTGSTSSNPAYGDAEWTVDTVEVLLGTGGPDYGISFTYHDDARVWYQDWFTAKEYVTLSSEAASRLAAVYGLEF
jgi:hypothetical protein